jgi:hypothetical protein
MIKILYYLMIENDYTIQITKSQQKITKIFDF